MIQTVTAVALTVIGVSIILALYRVVFGPSVPDRVVALDVVTVNAIAAIILFSIRSGSMNYLDSALVIAVLSFVSTVVVAKFLVKGEIIDRDGD